MTANAPSNAPASKPPALAGATTALVLLTALNFVNYIDRYILPGVNEQIKGEFHLSDGQIGALTTWFMVAYIAASPITGWIGDRFPRKPLIIAAALFMSAVNLLTASVHSYASLNLRHAALGIAEASFGIFAPALLSDFYPAEQRNRALTTFNVAIPVGAATGVLAGGIIGAHFGWRMSFMLSAAPGILFALMVAFLMKEPSRGAGAEDKASLEKGTVLSLLRNPAYLCAIGGYAAVTFALGGISWWMPSFLIRIDGRTQSQASLIMGGIIVVTGLLGTIIGGAVAQRWLKSNPAALYLLPATGALLALPFGLVCFFGPYLFHTHALTLPGLALSVFFIFLGSGPVNAATVNSVAPNIRATALAGQLLAIHLFGDVSSPTIIGIVSDHSNLAVGLGSTLITLVLAAVIFFAGARFVRTAHTVALEGSGPAGGTAAAA